MSKQSRARAAAEATTMVAPSSVPNEFSAGRWSILLAGGLIVLAALAAYHNSFSGPFVLDDQQAITDNPSIEHFRSALSPTATSITGGRPMLNLTYALNYAFGGMNVWGYHALNLAIHILAGLALFGIVRRTLLEHPPSPHSAGSGLRRTGPTSKAIYPELSECGRGEPPSLKLRRPCPTPQIVIPSAARNLTSSPATVLAFFVALLWTVHPLQTEAVTYISQRAESLMGLFYLLTLYCFIRGVESRGQTAEVRDQIPEIKSNPPISSSLSLSGLRPLTSDRCLLPSALWLLLSVIACFLGTMTKEVIVTAPVMVFLYDRTFVAGSFRKAWRSHGRYYLGLACTWLLLARLMSGLNQRGAGFDLKVTWWSYALTSCRSVMLYLKLAFWPHPLVLDYGTTIIRQPTEAVPSALVLAALILGTLIALRFRPIIGFAGAWFFLILAPTSSVVPVAGQPMAEHRMYLPLAAVVVLFVLGLSSRLGRRSVIIFLALAVGLGWLTVQRNNDYRSELSIWNDTVAKSPNNERAFTNLGFFLKKMPGRQHDEIAAYEKALRINPDYAFAHNNLGTALRDVPGRLSDAIAQFQAAIRINPNYVEAHNNLGSALRKVPGRLTDAIAEFQAALRINPDYVFAHNNLGTALFDVPGCLPDAIDQFQIALRLNPNLAEAHFNLANALNKVPERRPDAIAQYEEALRINPDYAEAHYSLGTILLNMPGRLPDAIDQFQAALRINPDYVDAHINFGDALSKVPGRRLEAIAQYEAALRINPDLMEAHVNLGETLLKVPGRFSDGVAQLRAALRLEPENGETHNSLGIAVAQQGHWDEAFAQFELAVRFAPKLASAHYNLGNVLVQSGRLAEAIGEYKTAVQLDPNSALAHHNLGMALFQSGRPQEAIEQYEQAVQIKPDFAEARDHLEQARKALGQPAR
jgi:tetratricopeptide (TPR) repeat protein